jgi:hypothetical protein
MSDYPLPAGRALRAKNLANYAEQLAAKNRELEQTQAALRKQLSDNADLSAKVTQLEALRDSRQAQQAERKTLLDVVAQSVTTLKGMEP